MIMGDDAKAAAEPRSGLSSKRAVLDVSPDAEQFLTESLAGLLAEPKTLPCKYLYDKEGSVLFDQICDTEEYYVTRTEVGIMRRHMPEIVEAIGPKAAVIEPGAGSGLKTDLLLDAFDEPAAFVPIEISIDHLKLTADRFAERFPSLPIVSVCADFTNFPELPALTGAASRVVYFPGSTIGNFAAEEREPLLESFADLAGPGGRLLIGVDLDKDPEVLKAAYNDSAGVTAAFNLNLLQRMNRELGADFDLDAFHHEARHNPARARMEMHLVSDKAQTVSLGDETIEFAAGETIHTENSHKFTVEGFKALASKVGFRYDRHWSDERGHFALMLFTMSA